jgi:SagB-type dehydrogenase family enzyme
VAWDARGAVGRNWFTRTECVLDEGAFALLERLGDWRPVDELFPADADEHERTSVATALMRLIDGGLVLVDGTPAARDDDRLAREWEWGATAGVFHFGIHDTVYVAPETIRAHVEARMATTAEIEVFDRAAPSALAMRVPERGDGLLRALFRRRSRRSFADADMPLAALAECLFAGFAIVGFAAVDAHGGERLPLGPCPSGGARHPFEAYVCAYHVAGLEPGVYRYTGIDHSLSRVHERPPPDPPRLLGGQTWFANAGALVLLVAHFQRTQRKYPHPGAFRVVLLEAGHIAQNVLVTAAAHELAATPTCAVSDRLLEETCGLDPITQAVVHVVALGARGDVTSPADFPACEENPALRGWLDGV